jgi:hypothetical protein
VIEIRNPAGSLVLTLGDTDVSSDGMAVRTFDQGERAWRRIVATSPVVDGEFEVQAARGGQRLILTVLIQGADWADVSAKRTALLNAVEVNNWRLVIGGVTWVCRVADSESPMPPLGTQSDWRDVTLTIPATQQIGV